jgi:hypothetical protein
VSRAWRSDLEWIDVDGLLLARCGTRYDSLFVIPASVLRGLFFHEKLWRSLGLRRRCRPARVLGFDATLVAS